MLLDCKTRQWNIYLSLVIHPQDSPAWMATNSSDLFNI
ncbi:hypothetical protein PHET_10510 [Paragonimus heterotremus]|uniref:Uncharacterized protein n=1 Tax=Paragonimus heterotremus TaxID=100268 RepID=A0A8J4SQZ3_9TREM|nr:hypothetical protein PHET_10510 [Paragonimus heterotremus]